MLGLLGFPPKFDKALGGKLVWIGSYIVGEFISYYYCYCY